KITLITAICALIIGVVIGTIIAFVQIIKSNNIGIRALKAVFNVYVAFFRGTPIVVQLLFIYFVVFPLMGLGTMMPEIVGIIIFGLNSGAYVSEIMRGGILSVDVGQTEAGRALGLSAVMTMVRIVFPQAIKNVIPTIANEFVSLLKETSVLSFIGVVDLTQAFKEIAGANYEYTVPYLVLALSYLVLVLIATGLVKILERRLRASDKR
ncbi:MAG: amino acid ABC transporter permease, partial [Clostridia bacterium]|nr:amino acid ABC transporter permease [Clostridia bacterium]